MYELGIIGGMGPEASALFYNKIVNYTDAKHDQDHIRLCILSCSDVPDRTESILMHSNAPVDYINESINELHMLGVKNFLIACNTSHFYADQFIIPKQMNFINIVDEACAYMASHFTDRKVCIIGTSGTAVGHVYDSYLSKYEKVSRLKYGYPAKRQQDELMELILDIKRGYDKNRILRRMRTCLSRISKGDPDIVFLLACTELSIFYKEISMQFPCVDVLDVAVMTSIRQCGRQIKPGVCEEETNICGEV